MIVLRVLFFVRCSKICKNNVINESFSNGVRCISHGFNLGIINNAIQSFSTTTHTLSGKSKDFKTVVHSSGNVVTKKVNTSPKIKLIDLKGSSKTTFFDDAQKLAKRQGLNLVRKGFLNDKEVFELERSYEVKKVSKVKKKIYLISSASSPYDIQHKVDNAIKQLNKGIQVDISVQLKNDKKELDEIADRIIKEIEQKHKVIGKVVKKTAINFTGIPTTKVDDEQTSEENGQTKKENSQTNEEKSQTSEEKSQTSEEKSQTSEEKSQTSEDKPSL